MASRLLENTRKITRLLQTTGSESMSFSDICRIIGEIIASNVYVISKKGKILGSYSGYGSKTGNTGMEVEVGKLIASEQNNEFLYLKETRANLKIGELKTIEAAKGAERDINITVVPISSGGERLGTLLIDKGNGSLTDDDLVLAEYGATVMGMEVLRSVNIENEMEIRKKAVVQLALESLSYSEMEAIVNIFRELEGNEGLLVASKIADKVGITRSVIVNALRKFESAGVIESRSLGMKGTHIKILNEKLMEELDKVTQK